MPGGIPGRTCPFRRYVPHAHAPLDHDRPTGSARLLPLALAERWGKRGRKRVTTIGLVPAPVNHRISLCEYTGLSVISPATATSSQCRMGEYSRLPPCSTLALAIAVWCEISHGERWAIAARRYQQ